MSKKYIKCDHCGAKIPFGENIIVAHHNTDCAYCCISCLIQGETREEILNDETAENYNLDVYDQKEDIKREIDELKKRIADLEAIL